MKDLLIFDNHTPPRTAQFVLSGKVANPQVSIYGDYNAQWHNNVLVGVNYSFGLAPIEPAIHCHDMTKETIIKIKNLLPDFSSNGLEKHRICKRGNLIMLKRKLGRKTIKSVQ